LWVADVELLPHDLPTTVPDELADTVVSLQRLVDSLRAQITGAEQLPVTPPYRWHDAGWVANRWCDVLPVGSELKQRLMSLDAPLLRLELVSDVLEKLRLDAGR
jgi:Lon protease-like protein